MSVETGCSPGLTRKEGADGQANPEYVDVLDEDRPIAGQRFTCVSFISPEKVLADKNIFMFGEYLKAWELNKSLEKFTQFLSFISYKHGLPQEVLTSDMKEFCKTERDNLFVTSLPDEFKTYLDANEERLEREFAENNAFRTSVRGLKVRGSYPSQEEAELRCKLLREADPNHDVYVGPVGMWMPFHPEAYKTGKVEYIEEELNQLMHEKRKNEAQAKTEFDRRIRETKEKAMEENRKKALETGNKLTQTITEDGDLVSVRDANTTESRFGGQGGDIATADLRKELFDGDNVVTDLSGTDHGVSRLTNPLDWHAANNYVPSSASPETVERLLSERTEAAAARPGGEEEGDEEAGRTESAPDEGPPGAASGSVSENDESQSSDAGSTETG